jgi:hypothetical protein
MSICKHFSLLADHAGHNGAQTAQHVNGKLGHTADSMKGNPMTPSVVMPLLALSSFCQ